MNFVEPADLVELVGDPVQHRPAPHGKQLFRHRVGKRPQAGRVPGGQHERVHAGTTRGSDSAYGARCTPASVTIAAISSAGVTSKAGLRAEKWCVNSAPP